MLAADSIASSSSASSRSKRSKNRSTSSRSSSHASSSSNLLPTTPVWPDLRPLPPRSFDAINEQVAQEIAFKAINTADTIDGVKINVVMTFCKRDDVGFLKMVAESIEKMCLQDYLFAIATIGKPIDSDTNYAILCGSSDDVVQRAVLLTTAKFIGRVDSAITDRRFYIAGIKNIGFTSYDEQALWDVARKSARMPIYPLDPPPGSRSIEQLLSDRRAKLQRLTPEQAYKELQEPEVGAPTFLVDIRPAAQREAEGNITSSLMIERNVLEWNFDPRSSTKLNIVDRYDLRIIVFCQDGTTSSLAAYSLQELGMLNATDMIGGYAAWRDAGLPVDIPIRDHPWTDAESEVV
ncbi:hypothetical protein K435DRAFT_843273 [Dendrothele bispora CBS 962.96]|uniref:Rhodanese domain-containing protein n=1 Tax=Dendrothele bispora (strain CBS 962.96) TaxID=1314807 RepID=A0A4S8L9F8_DENBC|nr:hypothetical protein K435DRAFT_843273 [Dendrothele bispora CBS 962.96]